MPINQMTTFEWFLISLIAIVLVAGIAHALWVFTRHLGGPMAKYGDEEEKVVHQRVRTMVRYGYVTIMALVAITVLPFALSGFPDPLPSPNSPMQILRACPAAFGQDANGTEQPYCPLSRVQWAVNIGGVFATKESKTASNEQPINGQIRAEAQNTFQNAGQFFRDVSGDHSNGAAKANLILSNLASPSGGLQVPVVTGGLVVPLYMIVIALIGGCIGMTRRLPEYQTRGAPGYVKYYDKNKSTDPTLQPPLDGEHVREYVVFQIMQAVFAPFLAVVAYALLDPADIAGIVAIGFIAGFASEPILVQLRKVADSSSKLFSGGQEQVPSPLRADGGQSPARKPELESLDPGSVTVGTDKLSVVVRGTEFAEAARVQLDGTPKVTDFRSPTEVVFELTAGDVAAAGEKAVTIRNSATDESESNALTLTVTA